MTLFRFVSLLLILTIGTAHAEADKSAIDKDLKAVEQNIDKSKSENAAIEKDLKSTERDLAKLEGSTKKLAKKVKDAETRAVELRMKLAELEAQEATIQEQVDALKKLITPMLKAGMDMARKPTDLNLFMEDPAKAADVMTAHVALRSAAKATQDYLDSYAKAKQELDQVQQDVLAEKTKLDAVVAELTGDREKLAAQMTEQEKLAEAKRGQLEKNQKELDALSAKRARLVDLLTSIKREEEERRAAKKRQAEQRKRELAEAARNKNKKTSEAPALPSARRSAPTLARGLPASGYVVQRFGEPDPDSGLSARGITIEGERGGLVTAPVNGEVRFTGPFKGFGKLVIIEHNNGDFSLLGGLGKISVSEGQKVGKGAPVGTLSASTSATPHLYYELRRGGSNPVDPMKLF